MKNWHAIVFAAVALGLPAHGAAQSQQSVERQAMISAITGDDIGLKQAYASAAQQQSLQSPSLAESIFYLYNSTRTSRDEFLSGQEILASNSKDKGWKNQVMVSLLSDEVYELNRLEGQNRFNKYTRIFNRVSTSLSQLVMLQPQAAASLLWDGIYGFKKREDPTIKERKMAFLCEQFLKKYPTAPERADVLALQQQLKAKMLKDRAKALTEAGKTAIAGGKFEQAEWHLEKAALLNPADTETNQLLTQARSLRNRADEVTGLSLGVSTAEGALTVDQRDAIAAAARGMITGKSSKLAEARQKAPGVWDSIDFAYAAQAEKSGDHAGALKRLSALASQGGALPGARAASRTLDNPNYNLNESFKSALADMSSEQKHFIWTGRRSKDETVYTAGSTVIQNAANPVAVPVLFGLDAAVRAISENFKTQVSVDGVIDAGARYLRKYPDAPDSKQIARQLADLSKKAGDYRRSKAYLEEAGGGTPEELAKIHENEARGLYEQLQACTDLLEGRKILQKLSKEYSDTKIAQKNLANAWAKIPPALAEDTLLIPSKAVQKDSSLAPYLGINPGLVDNQKSNGEITDDGIAITPSANAVEFRLKGEDRWRRATLGEKGREQLISAVRLLRQNFLKQSGADAEFYRQRLPFAIDGGVGGSGIDVSPKILPYPTSDADKKRFD